MKLHRTRIARWGIAACSLIALTTPPTAGAADDVLTPYHVAKIKNVGSAQISPDGKHIAYTLSVPRKPFDDESGPNWTELHVADLDGNSRPFITGEVNVGSVSWTPDGRAIAFLAKRGKDKHQRLYIIPLDGGEARQVLSHEPGIDEYTLSGDGKRVAFTARDKEPQKRKKLKDKGFSQEIFEEDYLPVRAWIAKLDDKEAEPVAMDLPGSPSDLVWAPVGTHLAVSLAPTPLIDDSYMQRKLHVFDVDTGAIVSSFKNPGKLGRPVWSPDGKFLAFQSAEDINDPSDGRLFVADPSTGALHDILPDYLGAVASIAWQDADTIMFLGDDGVWTTIQRIRRDGMNLKTILGIGKNVLSSLSLSRDGQSAAMVSDAPTHPRELFTMSHGDAGPRRLTNSNPWLDDIRLAKQEVISHTARDGLELQGLLIRPLDEQPAARYPLILQVHGGPEAHNRNGWLTRYASPGQVAAAHGYAVFVPNYRGSTGRGVAFSKMSQADYGGAEFDDLVDAVDHLIALGLVDKDRVGITGGSYGGYATAWCSTYHSERFAAGVMFVGISDHISKAGSTDIPNEAYLVHARKRLWDDWDFFLARSPIRYVEKARTPLLIMHGKNDPRVHPSQSLELYRNLKVLGQVPVRLVWYPGEGHGNRKSAAKLDYNLRMMRWFDYYLKQDGKELPPYEIQYEGADKNDTENGDKDVEQDEDKDSE